MTHLAAIISPRLSCKSHLQRYYGLGRHTQQLLRLNLQERWPSKWLCRDYYARRSLSKGQRLW